MASTVFQRYRGCERPRHVSPCPCVLLLVSEIANQKNTYARRAEATVPTPEEWLKEIEGRALKDAESKTVTVDFAHPVTQQVKTF